MLTPPTAAELKARYPDFGGAPDPIVTAILAETTGAVDESWIEADRKPAMLAYAAHMLTAEGVGVDNTVTVGGDTFDVTGPLKTVKVGDVQVGFGGDVASRAGDASAADLTSSAYGRRYLELLRRSHPPVLVA